MAGCQDETKVKVEHINTGSCDTFDTSGTSSGMFDCAVAVAGLNDSAIDVSMTTKDKQMLAPRQQYDVIDFALAENEAENFIQDRSSVDGCRGVRHDHERRPMVTKETQTLLRTWSIVDQEHVFTGRRRKYETKLECYQQFKGCDGDEDEDSVEGCIVTSNGSSVTVLYKGSPQFTRAH